MKAEEMCETQDEGDFRRLQPYARLCRADSSYRAVVLFDFLRPWRRIEVATETAMVEQREKEAEEDAGGSGDFPDQAAAVRASLSVPTPPSRGRRQVLRLQFVVPRQQSTHQSRHKPSKLCLSTRVSFKNLCLSKQDGASTLLFTLRICDRQEIP